MKDFITYCKDYLREHIDGYQGQSHYLCDFGYVLTDGPNADGSLTYSRSLAMDWLKEWWKEAADYFDYERVQFGQNTNPFDNPEAYMVCMVIEGVSELWSRAIDELGMSDKWNDKVELTRGLIARIKKCVKDMYVEKLF